MILRNLPCVAAAMLLPAFTFFLSAKEPSRNDDRKNPAPPWHLLDLWWDIGKDMPFESYSVDVTIDDDVPSTVNLYIAPIGLGHLSKTQFYGGIQTQSDARTKKDKTNRKIGPGLIFSMWGERSLDAIRPSIGGYCESSGHEGDFVSVRRPYEWNKGKYTYRIVRMDREEVDGQPYTWIGAFVYSHEKDENAFIGALRFKGDDLVLSRSLASFVEIYGHPIPIADIPRLTITFGNLRVNGKPVDGPTALAVYPKEVPDYAEAAAKEGAIVVTVGRPIEGRRERRVELLKK